MPKVFSRFENPDMRSNVKLKQMRVAFDTLVRSERSGTNLKGFLHQLVRER